MPNLKPLSSVTNVAWRDIVPQTPCTIIEVDEDRQVVGYPTTSLQYRTDTTGTVLTNSPGTPIVLTMSNGYFVPGRVYGQVKTLTGTTDLIQKEDGA